MDVPNAIKTFAEGNGRGNLKSSTVQRSEQSLPLIRCRYESFLQNVLQERVMDGMMYVQPYVQDAGILVGK